MPRLQLPLQTHAQSSHILIILLRLLESLRKEIFTQKKRQRKRLTYCRLMVVHNRVEKGAELTVACLFECGESNHLDSHDLLHSTNP